MDWPFRTQLPDPMIVSGAEEWVNETGEIPIETSATWPTAGQAIALPVVIRRKMTLKRFYAFNGAAVSGNCDIGLYSWQTGLSGLMRYPTMHLLSNAGSTLQAGTNVWQVFDVADLVLAPGRYYLAYVLDNVVGTVMRLATMTNMLRRGDIRVHVPSPTFPLPATFFDTPPFAAAIQLPLLALGGID